MGKPAARLGDVSAHGGTLVLGVPTVLIGKMPAGTLGDMHVCPMVTGVVPHVGGPTALGSMGVLLGKKPAVRISDMAPCVGPPDMMAMGCMTVLIGEMGGGGGGGAAAAAAAAKAAQLNGPKTIAPYDPIEPAEPRTENHYVECAVTDSAGLPLSGLRYTLTDPDGKKIVGAISSEGRIRHDGYSQAGSFKVEMACLANVKWSKAKSKPNEKLTLKADAEGMEDGTACAAMVFEASGDGNQRLLKSLDGKVQGKKIKIDWTLTTEELAKVHPDAPKGKVEYFFILVAAGNVGVSDAMQCLDTANIEILDPDEKPLAESKYELHLRDGSIRTGKTDKQGKAEEKDVPAGPYMIVLPEIVLPKPANLAAKPGTPSATPTKPSGTRQKPAAEESASGNGPAPVNEGVSTTEEVASMSEEKIEISAEMVKAGGDSLTDEQVTELVTALNKYAPTYEVNTSFRISHFLSQVGHESGFKATTENLNYSATRMKQIFGCNAKDWKDDDCEESKRTRPKLWSETSTYEKNAEKLGNYVYADRLGNGDETSGDGYKYRGRGLLQVTGKSNYQAFTDNHNKKNPEDKRDFVKEPDLVSDQIEFAIESAFSWWELNKMNPLCKEGGDAEITKVTKKVNGGTNGLADRKTRFENVIKLFETKSAE